MRSIGAGKLNLLLAAAVLATVVTPVAIAGADGTGASRASKKVTVKQFKALKKKTTALARQVAALRAELKALAGGIPGPAGPQGPAAPIGPAGGDLTGAYPDPEIRAETIVSGDILNGTIVGADILDSTIATSDVLDETLTGGDIRDATVGTADIGVEVLGLNDLALNSVGSRQLAGTVAVKGNGIAVPSGNQFREAAATCPFGMQLLSGGIAWSDDDKNLVTVESGPLVTDPPPTEVTTWRVVGQNNTAQSRTLFATVLCLKRE